MEVDEKILLYYRFNKIVDVHCTSSEHAGIKTLQRSVQLLGEGAAGAPFGGKTGHPFRRHIGRGETSVDESRAALGFSPGDRPPGPVQKKTRSQKSELTKFRNSEFYSRILFLGANYYEMATKRRG
jgi:hypothetical protein